MVSIVNLHPYIGVDSSSVAALAAVLFVLMALYKVGLRNRLSLVDTV